MNISISEVPLTKIFEKYICPKVQKRHIYVYLQGIINLVIWWQNKSDANESKRRCMISEEIIILSLEPDLQLYLVTWLILMETVLSETGCNLLIYFLQYTKTGHFYIEYIFKQKVKHTFIQKIKTQPEH